MDLFIQVKKAYDIINNPQKRAIYDTLGMKGLREEGWEVRILITFKYVQFFPEQIISRTKTAREILDEYERLAKEREERRLNQMTNTVVCSFIVFRIPISLLLVKLIEFSTLDN